MKLPTFKLSLFLCLLLQLTATADDFNWRKATVYFVITDRFANGDTTNDINYGRVVDYGSGRLNAATFHGGDFKGMLQKAREGWFRDMGVDVVWMTDVYEQIHGWMSRSGAVNDFPHYGYHGYYPLDYTQIDKNFGTVEEFRELVDELHSQGIRVMLGANINDPGYPTLLDAVQLGFAPTQGITEEDATRHDPGWSYDRWTCDMANWKDWWTREWLRMPDENWDQSNPLTVTLYGLPDYKDEKTTSVKLPVFLKKKWEMEKSSNNAWINPSARSLRKDRNWAPADYVIAWIASWVEEFGIDGFRCDIVEYVHLPRWKQLSKECTAALNRWREKHPESPAATWKDEIYLTGDFDFASIDYKADYADAGFSSMVNCYFPKHGDLDAIIPVWQAYADSINTYANWHPFNYLNNSYHRDADLENMIDCSTTLLLAPGVAQIFYGDESGRKASEGPKKNVDSDQSFRSDMNWDNVDTLTLSHYRKLGKIRKNHPAIGFGRQTTIDNYTCVRVTGKDTVVIRVNPNVARTINCGDTFRDNTLVTELYTGQNSQIKNGHVKFRYYKNNVAIITKQD